MSDSAAKLCGCGACTRCKARMRQRYKRARDRGFQPPKPMCECGTCDKCRARARAAAWREERRRLAEAGEQPPKSARQIMLEAKRAQLKAWRAARRAEAEAQAILPALNERQVAQVRTVVWEMLRDLLGE